MSERKTIFSPDRVYRYTLWREWDNGDLYTPKQITRAFEYAMFIGLNPSTADETKDDPTIRKCIGFAKRWGYGALCMTNLFAFRATQPKDMKRNPCPIGEGSFCAFEVATEKSITQCFRWKTDAYLFALARQAGVVVAAWGVNGTHLNRDKEVRGLIPSLRCLRKTKDGHPEHPLYIPYEVTPIDL